MMKFKVGDIVQWCGNIGTVTRTDSIIWPGHEMVVSFEEVNKCMYFTLDGKVYPWNKEPSLKIISRAIKLYQVLYIDNTNNYMMTYDRYSSESEFKYKYPDTCRFVKFVDETMIEAEA